MADDQVVIVTGAAAGLGRAMTLGLLAAGRRVAGVDLERSAAGLATIAAEAAGSGAAERFLPISASVTSEQDSVRAIDATIAHFGCVDALVNNAGLGMAWISPDPTTQEVPFYTCPVDKWRTLIDTNVNGPFLMARAVAPHLVARGWGRIVNVTTTYGSMVRFANSPYGPAKAALESATAIWSKDLAATGVTVNVLIPGGASDTAMLAHEHVPDRSTLISPSVMVAPIVWLTSRASDGITGQRFIASRWQPGAPNGDNAAHTGSPAAAWPTI